MMNDYGEEITGPVRRGVHTRSSIKRILGSKLIIQGLLVLSLLAAVTIGYDGHRHNGKNPNQLLADSPKEIRDKKKIIIFSSKGGGGHIAASQAITAYLGEEYEVKTVNVFTEVLGNLDPFSVLSRRWCNGEDLYNYLLRSGNFRLASAYKNIGAIGIVKKRRSIERYLLKYLAQENPDLVISVIPFLNASTLRVAASLDIPFLVATTDLDTSNYVTGFDEDHLYDKFYYTLAFDHPAMRALIAKAPIPPDKIVISGFPVRDHFFEKKDRVQIRRDLEVPEGKPVVMVLMGAVGGEAALRYARRLCRMKMSLHLLVCTGRNESLKRKVSRLRRKGNITMTVIGYTDRISDLMAVSNLLITKPGPNSLCEAFQMKLPVLLDGTSKPLTWEKFNITFVLENGFGEVVEKVQDLEGIIERFFRDKNYYRLVKRNLQHFPIPCFKDNIRELVHRLIDQETSA